jgi:hypothetical protein
MAAAAAPQLYAEVEQDISDVNRPTMGKSVVEKTGTPGAHSEILVTFLNS